MIKTQIQMPDELYRKAKQLAQDREMSLAEVVRRGLEYMLAVYPPLAEPKKEWHLPKPVRLGWKGLTPEEMRDVVHAEEVEHRFLREPKRAVR